MAFGFYNLACILLIMYKPASKFAIRSIRGNIREDDVRIDPIPFICGVKAYSDRDTRP